MNIVQRVKIYLRARQFEPGFGGLFVNPFYFARKGLSDHIRAFAGELHGKLLDVGCGQKPYEQYFSVTQYIGLERSGGGIVTDDRADVYYDGSRFPFEDGEFDSVLTNEVFEHVFNPGDFLSELNRVVKPGGKVLMTVPFLWAEHMQPYDYARYSSFGLRALLEGHGFEIVRHSKSMNDIRVLFQLLNSYIYQKTETKNSKINLLLCVLLMAPFNVLGQICSWILPKSDDLYLDNVILARKLPEG